VTGVLDDLVVLDLTRFLSGPYATLLLAGMGAQVIKIDDPATGDPTVASPPYAGRDGATFQRGDRSDLGLAYLKRARGKQSANINLKHAQGRELFLRLVEQADVVVENFRPGVADRLGIGYDTLATRNPRLVYCALTGFGSTGPDRDLKAYDLMVQAASGLMAITGEPDGAPMKTATAFSDMTAGSYMVMAILGALHERERSGKGQAVDVSMVECLFSMMMDEPLDCYQALGLEPRQGNRIMRFSPFNAYQASDGWLTIGAASAFEWNALLEVMEREDLREHADFSRLEWRIANNEQVDEIVSGWVSRHTVSEVVGRLGEADVPCSAVRTPRDAIDWPQLRERGAVRPLQRPDGSDALAVAADLPFRFSRSKSGHRRPAPEPGGDTDDVLRRFLGMEAEEVAQLRVQGIV
jgi:formyl-CoA transferase